MPTLPSEFRRAIAEYDRRADSRRLDGARYRMTYRVLGAGPTLVVAPGIVSTYHGYAAMLLRLAPRFRTVIYDYPGDHRDDGANLRTIDHDDLVSDLLDLLDHLGAQTAVPFGPSFGSTITLAALRRAPRRFPVAALQGGFAYRRFTMAERMALRLGRHVPGRTRHLPGHTAALSWKNRRHFGPAIADRWQLYVEHNGETPIPALTHRLDLLARLDLRPILPEIVAEIALIQGADDAIVPRACYDALASGLPRATGILLPGVGHQPHYTDVELIADLVGDFADEHGAGPGGRGT